MNIVSPAKPPWSNEKSERGPAGKAQLLDQGIEYVQPELVRLRVFTKPTR